MQLEQVINWINSQKAESSPRKYENEKKLNQRNDEADDFKTVRPGKRQTKENYKKSWIFIIRG